MLSEQNKILQNILTRLSDLTHEKDLISRLIQDITGYPHSILEQLPEAFRRQYLNELEIITNTIDPTLRMNAEHLKAIEALNFEKTKLIALTFQGHNLSPSAIKISNKQTYLKYDKKISTRDAILLKPEYVSKIIIQNDVPILKNTNGLSKPYIYETKYYPSTRYGTRGKDLNQLLKYQKAFEKDIIAGATLDIQGCISEEFIDWVIEKRLLPGVQIIYTLKLPSGKIYTTEIMSAPDNKNSIIITNQCNYDTQDQNLINKFKHITSDFKALKRVLSIPITLNDLTDEKSINSLRTLNQNGKTNIEQPYEIRDAHIYKTYITAQQEKIWKLITEYEYMPTIAENTKATI